MDILSLMTNSVFLYYFILAVTIWTLPWKGVALWMAARRKHLIWFICLLILNTLAILEILYIFIFSKYHGKSKKLKKTNKKKRKR